MSETEIINTEYKLGIIPAKTPHDVIIQATVIAKELAKIVKDNRLSLQIQGREYVYVEGWSTMGAMLGVLPREVTEMTRRHDDGSYEATVELIRITDGAVIGRASAYVGIDEKDRKGRITWGNRPEYARRSMAITRATGKAYRLGFSWIMGLAGYAPTPAEEMDGIMDGEFKEETTTSAEASQEIKPPAKPPKPKSNGKPNDTPLPVMMVNEGIASNVPHAAEIANKLHLGNLNRQDAIKLGKEYRALRDGGMTTEEATAKILGEEISK